MQAQTLADTETGYRGLKLRKRFELPTDLQVTGIQMILKVVMLSECRERHQESRQGPNSGVHRTRG